MQKRTLGVEVLAVFLALVGLGCGHAEKPSNAPIQVKRADKGSPSASNTALTRTPPTAPEKPIAVLAPLGPPAKAMKGWDFVQLAPAQWEWRLPGGVQVPSAKGARFTLAKNGPGPVLVLDKEFDASGIVGIRVEIEAFHPGEAGETPVSVPWMAFHWACDDDMAIAKDPAWPFDNERAVTMRASDPARPTVWTASLNTNKLWKAKLRRAFINLNIAPEPSGESKPCIFALKSIELLVPVS